MNVYLHTKAGEALCYRGCDMMIPNRPLREAVGSSSTLSARACKSTRSWKAGGRTATECEKRGTDLRRSGRLHRRPTRVQRNFVGDELDHRQSSWKLRRSRLRKPTIVSHRLRQYRPPTGRIAERTERQKFLLPAKPVRAADLCASMRLAWPLRRNWKNTKGSLRNLSRSEFERQSSMWQDLGIPMLGAFYLARPPLIIFLAVQIWSLPRELTQSHHVAQSHEISGSRSFAWAGSRFLCLYLKMGLEGRSPEGTPRVAIDGAQASRSPVSRPPTSLCLESRRKGRSPEGMTLVTFAGPLHLSGPLLVCCENSELRENTKKKKRTGPRGRFNCRKGLSIPLGDTALRLEKSYQALPIWKICLCWWTIADVQQRTLQMAIQNGVKLPRYSVCILSVSISVPVAHIQLLHFLSVNQILDLLRLVVPCCPAWKVCLISLDLYLVLEPLATASSVSFHLVSLLAFRTCPI
eukprot:Gb_19979 [translate_table: standard]